MADSERLRQIEVAIGAVANIVGIRDPALRGELIGRIVPPLFEIAERQETLDAFRTQLEQPIESRIITHPFVVDWLRGRRSGDIDKLVALGQRMEQGIRMVVQICPAVESMISAGYTTEEQMMASTPEMRRDGQGTAITDLGVIVRGEGGVHYVTFVDQNYPGLGITKGFTVFRHQRPETYTWSDLAYVRQTGNPVWVEVEKSDQQRLPVVTMAMIGQMDQLTAPDDSRYLHQLLPFVAE